MTAHASAESAVEAMKAGAADYVMKPFANDELRLRVRRLAAQREAERRSDALLARLTPALVAQSAAMREVLAAARRVGPTDATVLLLGESGTGKSQVARFVHYHSRRAAGPLVEVHCAALPDTLLEGELFGYEKGAFTGATRRSGGHLAAADQGTLFLDEIGEIPPATQVKLLRFLQERRFVPLGSTEERRVDARVVAATNRDLEAAVRAGAFREDFYYRLNVFAIRVPALRERPEDVLPISERFLEARGAAGRLTPGARARLRAHPWPGNVRELENALERALILAGDGDVREEHLAARRRTASPPRRGVGRGRGTCSSRGSTSTRSSATSSPRRSSAPEVTRPPPPASSGSPAAASTRGSRASGCGRTTATATEDRYAPDAQASGRPESSVASLVDTAPHETVCSVLTVPALPKMAERERRARGIAVVIRGPHPTFRPRRIRELQPRLRRVGRYRPAPRRLNHELHPVAAPQLDRAEAAHVPRRQPHDPDLLRQGDDRCVHEPEPEVGVLAIDLHRAGEGAERGPGVREGTAGQIAHERGHRLSLVPEEVVHLCEHQPWDVAGASGVDRAAEGGVIRCSRRQVDEERARVP